MKTKLIKTDEEGWIQLELIEEPIISQKTIKKIKKKLEEDGVDDLEDEDKKKLKEKKEKSSYDRITKGLLFIECLDKLKESITSIECDEKKEVEEYLGKIDSEELRNLIEEYNEGYGAYITGEKIKDVVDEKKSEIEIVINMFSSIFGGDD